jgi:tetratricopeptide (TPR) repeat protein
MVYQRQHKTQPAVREYLAIARILQMQGEKQKALQMCMAALRLDPGNEDVRLAIDLIQRGEEAFREQEEEEEQVAAEPDDDGALVGAVRQMAAMFESEMKSQPSEPAKPLSHDPVDVARRLAQEQLAEEIFRDEEEEDMATGETGLSKLERDALIGQGMDFELRGQVNEAISCYERAIKGGLRMPAAFYTLGLLYREQGRAEAARRTLQLAARDKAYREAARLALDNGGQV